MKNQTRWLAVFDSHGDMIDKNARDAVLQFSKHWKPSLVIHGGDFMDLRALRRGATDEERDEGVKNDIEAGIDFVRSIKTNVLLWGNHDQRLVRESSLGNGRKREYANLVLDQIYDRLEGIEHIPYGKRKGVYKLGNYRVVHGYHAGLYAHRQAAQVYGNVMMGHVHTNAQFDDPAFDKRTGISVGCLCNLDMEYVEAQANTLRWSHGFAYGIISHGETIVWLARKLSSGLWILPSEIRTI